MYGMNPYMNQYQMYNQVPSQPVQNTLIRVSGIDGARAYQMNANSTVALFDNNSDLMYIKTTDGAGFPTIRTFKFEETNSQMETKSNYITREEMEEYVKQLISAKES